MLKMRIGNAVLRHAFVDHWSLEVITCPVVSSAILNSTSNTGKTCLGYRTQKVVKIAHKKHR